MYRKKIFLIKGSEPWNHLEDLLNDGVTASIAAPYLSPHLLKKILLTYLFIFRERGKEGEKHQCVVVSCGPPLGTWPITQACALTRNQTSDPLIPRPAINP